MEKTIGMEIEDLDMEVTNIFQEDGIMLLKKLYLHTIYELAQNP